MSTILDSLKKSSEQRDDNTKNPIDNFNFGRNSNKGRSRSYLLLILLLMTVAILYFGYRYINDGEEIKTSTVEKSVEQVVADNQVTSTVGKLASIAPAVVGTEKKDKPNSQDVKQRIKEIKERRRRNKPSLKELNKPRSVGSTAIAEKVETPIIGNTKKTPEIKLRLPDENIKKPKIKSESKQEYLYVYQLPFSVRKDIPKLKLNIHVYEKEPGNRIAIINGVKFVVDEMIDDVVLVKEITRNGVLLEFNNREFLLPK